MNANDINQKEQGPDTAVFKKRPEIITREKVKWTTNGDVSIVVHTSGQRMKHVEAPGSGADPEAESQFIGNARSSRHKQGHIPQDYGEQTPEAAQNTNAEGCGWIQNAGPWLVSELVQMVLPSSMLSQYEGSLKEQIV